MSRPFDPVKLFIFIAVAVTACGAIIGMARHRHESRELHAEPPSAVPTGLPRPSVAPQAMRSASSSPLSTHNGRDAGELR